MMDTTNNEDELRLKHKKRWPANYVPLALAVMAYIASFRWSQVSMADRNLIIFAWLIYNRAIQSAFDRYDRRRVDVDATARMRDLVGTSGAGQVRVDESLDGLDHVNWFREKDEVVVSHRALRDLTREELDFVLASAAGPTNTRPTDNLLVRGLYGIPVFAVSIGLAYGIAHLHIAMLAVTALVLAIAAGAGTMMWADAKATSATKERTTQADDAALKITGDGDAAESALTKAIDTMAATDKSTWEARLSHIRNAEHRALASTLPPRGWKPS